MDIVGYITKLQTNVFQIRNDDDFADRLNYRYTVAILAAFAVIVTNRQFSESVIKCWVPAYFTQNYEAYANQVCWISNTYYVNQSHQLPNSDDHKKQSEIKYYQWIPFILLIQALFLHIPRIIWRMLSARAGIEMRDLVEAANSYKTCEKYEKRQKIMEYIIDNIEQYVSNPRRLKKHHSIIHKIKFYSTSICFGSGVYLGNYLVTTYMFIKILYILNSIGQFFLMNEFLGKQFHELGFDILQYITTGQSIQTMLESVYFPKVVMCDFRIREFGHPNFSHRYSIQCVLPINLYNQQVFTFLWFWFLLLFLANFTSILLWSYRLMTKVRKRYIRQRLSLFKDQKEFMRFQRFFEIKQAKIKLNQQTKYFIDSFLNLDGIFIIRTIAILTSDIVGTEILQELWKRYENIENNYITKKINFQKNNELYSSSLRTERKKQMVSKKSREANTRHKANSIPEFFQQTQNPKSFNLNSMDRENNSVEANKAKKVVFAFTSETNVQKFEQDESKAYNHKATYPYIDHPTNNTE